MFDLTCCPVLTDDKRLPVQTSQWESKNISNLFFIGTLTQERDYKKSSSSFIHGFRYNARTLTHFLEERFFGIPYPRSTLLPSVSVLTQDILHRINTTSGLWQQFGFLADVYMLHNNSVTVEREIPLSILQDRFPADSLLAISLEYGAQKGFTRVHRNDYKNGHKSVFIHPVIRWYHKGILRAEQHILEDIEARWDEEVHIFPFQQILKSFLNEKMLPGSTHRENTFSFLARVFRSIARV